MPCLKVERKLIILEVVIKAYEPGNILNEVDYDHRVFASAQGDQLDEQVHQLELV